MMVEKMNSLIAIDEERCIGCKSCIAVCPRDCFELNEYKKATIVNQLCHSCGHCISICPEDALQHTTFPQEQYALIDEYLSSDLFSHEQLYYFLKSIRSTRKFKDKTVPKEILEQLVDVTRYAPTGHHAQNVELVMVTNPITIEQLKNLSAVTIEGFLKKIDNKFNQFIARLAGKGAKIKKALAARSRFTRMLAGFKEGRDYLFHGAPAIAVFHAKQGGIVASDNCNQAAAYLRILAHSYGLGSCFIGYLVHFARENSKILELLQIPPENEIIQVVILGYPEYPFRRFVARKAAAVEWL
jgi:nitroreductase/NAD-dependent dihydropyrimidine dehydrogenase PreA subunit